ncbi:hypothetical protein [Actinoplanes derwentensis]|uniref:Uncharacterized protein n=1 Tax=Actinoplanes derwentensis TaxID=113562 RepID=A0A1H1SA30_9ACTN|nr:hypothetical protein [Actinoplanes derwentensis]GID83355.1 hypothetical protein Ade03nite_22790 [Actinoplanes derwentensis]SDS44824.1 hypothetical protein SAMN04489716_0807 [Actinoplanes derwentensis]
MEIISLTGPDSHRLKREPGVGSCSLGGPDTDLQVAPGDTINWSAFDPYSTPAGSHWPRWITYEGDDTGWAAWSQHRPIEGLTWSPQSAQDLDASRADIHSLSVRVRRAPLRLVLPPGHNFFAGGDLILFTPVLAPGAQCPTVGFSPTTTLPIMPALARAASVSVSVQPLRKPFDCASLLQFTELRHLQLSGSMTNLEALAELRGLTGLHLRFVPEMAGLPSLNAWPELLQLIAWNVDDREGKRLRTELRRAVHEGWEYSSVSKSRSAEWFATEYRLPFSAWPPKSARAAVKAFRAAEKAVGTATTEFTVETAVRGFVAAINRLPRIETTEREDAQAAVALLATDTPLGDLRKPADDWFETTRDF